MKVIHDGSAPPATLLGGWGDQIRDEINLRHHQTGAVGLALSGKTVPAPPSAESGPT